MWRRLLCWLRDGCMLKKQVIAERECYAVSGQLRASWGPPMYDYDMLEH